MFKCKNCNITSRTKTGIIKHTELCNRKISFLNKYNLTKEKIQFEYDRVGSVLEFSKIYHGEGFGFYYKLFKDLDINYSIKSSSKHKNTRNKYRQTCLDKWGTEHNFSRDCQSRIDWQEKMFKDEGITNVFQRPEVIEKCVNTIIEKYGDKTSAGMKFQKGSAISSLNKWAYNVLNENNIEYNSEFVIKNKQNVKKYYSFDIRVKDKLIEIQGDYWHGNPKVYKPNDLIMKGSSAEIFVADKWAKDQKKYNVAKENGYKLLIIWESEIKNNEQETIRKIIEFIQS